MHLRKPRWRASSSILMGLKYHHTFRIGAPSSWKTNFPEAITPRGVRVYFLRITGQSRFRCTNRRGFEYSKREAGRAVVARPTQWILYRGPVAIPRLRTRSDRCDAPSEARCPHSDFFGSGYAGLGFPADGEGRVLCNGWASPRDGRRRYTQVISRAAGRTLAA